MTQPVTILVAALSTASIAMVRDLPHLGSCTVSQCTVWQGSGWGYSAACAA